MTTGKETMTEGTDAMPVGIASTDQLEPANQYRYFGGMVWAVPCERMDELARALTFAPDGHVFTMSERLAIRSFLDAYRELVALPQRARNDRARELKKGPGNGGL